MVKAKADERLWRKSANKNRRIDPGVVQADIPVQVRTRGAAGGADFAERAATRQLIADFYPDQREVAEHADQALAVIDKHGFTIEEVIARQDDLARCGALIGVPLLAAKSRPECGLRSSPLKKRRKPKGLESGPLTGLSNSRLPGWRGLNCW